MSNLYFFLLFASHFLKLPYLTADANEEVKPFHLQKLLHDVVSMVYWLTTSASSTSADFKYVMK